jgi:uncharacterized protein YkwD
MSHTLAPSRTVRTLSLTLAITGGTIAGLAQPSQAARSIEQIRTAQISRTNEARHAKGCRPLKPSSNLTRSAQGHANDMSARDYFSHTSQSGRTWVKRIKAAGFKDPGGENIARGFYSATAVHRAWMNSPDHRRNILNCQFRHIGVGYTADGGYWVQDFGY